MEVETEKTEGRKSFKINNLRIFPGTKRQEFPDLRSHSAPLKRDEMIPNRVIFMNCQNRGDKISP